jgi:type II secretory pathway component PulM
LPKNKWVVVIAVAVALIAGIWIYRFIFPPEPPQVETTNQALEAAKQENADMKRRLDELAKQVKQGAKQIKVQEREKVDALPPDAIADAIADELRLFLGTD